MSCGRIQFSKTFEATNSTDSLPALLTIESTHASLSSGNPGYNDVRGEYFTSLEKADGEHGLRRPPNLGRQEQHENHSSDGEEGWDHGMRPRHLDTPHLKWQHK